jgi:hypothetical protein
VEFDSLLLSRWDIRVLVNYNARTLVPEKKVVLFGGGVCTTIGALTVRRTSEADWMERSSVGLLDEEPISARWRGQLGGRRAMSRESVMVRVILRNELFGGRNFNGTT